VQPGYEARLKETQGVVYTKLFGKFVRRIVFLRVVTSRRRLVRTRLSRDVGGCREPVAAVSR
jgi:hypothetical protein